MHVVDVFKPVGISNRRSAPEVLVRSRLASLDPVSDFRKSMLPTTGLAASLAG